MISHSRILAFFLSFFVVLFSQTLSLAQTETEPVPAEETKTVGPTMTAAEFLDETADDVAAPFSGSGAVEAPAGAPKPKFKKAVVLSEDIKKKEEEGTVLPGGRIKMSGSYRLAAGVDNDFILNDANINQDMFKLQGPNYRYLFGERQNNTHDRALYNQHRLNIDFSPADPVNFYVQIVNDPWSYVGTTGDQRVQSGGSVINPNFKYWGGFNGVLGETWRANTADYVDTPEQEVEDGFTTPYSVQGFFTPFPSTFSFGRYEVDYEYRPVRKLWMDTSVGPWQTRVFALADETQALTSDDPLRLSNAKDYWENSPWLYDYKPILFFTGGSVRRGFYSSELSFLARDSEGNRHVLLRGASLEGDFDQTSIAATVASPYSPWDEDYFDSNNFPGAVRIKHQVNSDLMLGGTYTFRTGLVDDSVADFGQTGGADLKYNFDENTALTGAFAISHREQDLLTDEQIRTSQEGNAYHAALEKLIEHPDDRETNLVLSYTQMDKNFRPLLSRYLNTRDDNDWSLHLRFEERPDIESFRLGDGVDTNRSVLRAQWKEKLFKDKFENLFDIRNVHKTDNTAYVETVLRDEPTYRINSQWTLKGLFRWRGLPASTPNIDPIMTNFYFPKDNTDLTDFTFRNTAVQADKDADQFTYSLGLQYVHDERWTFEAFAELTNAIPDFPRGLLFDFFSNPATRIDGILTDNVQLFIYDQGALDAAPPYDYFQIFRQRIIFTPNNQWKFIAHAAQNTYHFWGGIDDNITHVGLSTFYEHSQKLSFAADYTHSWQYDLPHLIASGLTERVWRGHDNIYASVDYRLNTSALLRAEYGVFNFGSSGDAYSVTTFSLPTLDTEHLFRLSLEGDF